MVNNTVVIGATQSALVPPPRLVTARVSAF